jgi:hypothetical protein
MPRRIPSCTPLALFAGLAACTALATAALADQAGIRVPATTTGRFTTRALMAQPQTSSALVSQARATWDLAQPDRTHLVSPPDAPQLSSSPPEPLNAPSTPPVVLSPQTIGPVFTGPTLADCQAFPPDNMGCVGPSQFIAFVNGRIRSFDKATGVADGVLETSPDAFFASAMTPIGNGIVVNFTSDPQIRYDRLSGCWFLTIIDVPCTDPTCSALNPNRLLMAVSDAASQGTITASTVWTFSWFQPDTASFMDYPSLGVDARALYIGGDMFASDGTLSGTSGYVVRKSSALDAGPLFVTAFPNLALGVGGEGPWAPRGVDNFDPAANEGYFIGVSNIAYSRLVFRRVSDPGGTPTISDNIIRNVSSTAFPPSVAHLGNANGAFGQLDAVDDRLLAAHIRNGRLFTAQSIAVASTGVGSSYDPDRRDAVRWYELNGIRSTDNSGLPVVVRFGTLYDPARSLSTARQYWMPSIMVSGQGHAALGFSTAGVPFYVDAGTVGRLASYGAGALGTPEMLTSSSTSYNPAGNPGGPNGRRWGDYSFTSLDPLDDMTMWTIQQFCDDVDSYGCRIARLVAPPPATPSGAPDVEAGNASVVVTLTGTPVIGSGFFDPGADLPGVPAFHHLSATVTNTGVTGTPPTVNAVTYVNPTMMLLDLNTGLATPNVGGEKYGVLVTNPDGQNIEGHAVLRVVEQPTATQLAMFTANGTEAGIEVRWQLGAPEPSSRVTLERSDEGVGEWTTLDVALRADGETTVALDRSALPGVAYEYRLRVQDSAGGEQVFGPVRGTLAAAAGRASLDGVRPNPTSGAVQLLYTVGTSGPVRLSVFDVQGREVAVIVDAVETSGRHVAQWDGRGSGAIVEAGVYFVRYRALGIEQSRRLTVTNPR